MPSSDPPRRAFRLVCAPPQRPLVEAMLREQGFVFAEEPVSPFCRRLLEEPFPLGRSVAAFFGLIYIQDRSSMLPPLALAPAEGSRVLDLCASPGSKSGLAAQLVGPHGLVLANEPNPPRLATLRRNLAQLNLWQCASTALPGETVPGEGLWPAILLDPPCSGWGTTDKHPGMLREWRGDRLQPLLALQRRLLERAAALLAPGGRLVYSTCTTNVDENEAQVLRAADDLGLCPVPLAPFPGFGFAPPALGCHGVLRVDEATSNAQGFFVALLEKPGTAETAVAAPLVAAPLVGLSAAWLNAWNVDPAALPPGRADSTGKELRFLPAAAVGLNAPVQGLALGQTPAAPSPRLRQLSRDGALPVLDIDTIADLQTLMQGGSLTTGLAGSHAVLFWRGLPLGRVRLKGGRALWSEK